MSRSIRLLDDAELIFCTGCHGLWTRQVKRGRKPKLCPECRTVSCEWCGDEFSVKYAHGTERQFCSSECSAQHLSARPTPEPDPCSVPGCEQDGGARSGYCRKHWSRVNKHGHWRLGTRECKDCGCEFQSDIGQPSMSKSRCYWCLTLECKRCGKRAYRRKDDQEFCSRGCYEQHRTDSCRPMCECNNCGKEFRLQRSDRSGKYCSRECSYDDWHSWGNAEAARGARFRPPAPIEYTPLVQSGPARRALFECEHCGDWYTAKRKGTKYCSSYCCHRDHYVPVSERRDPVAKTCANCGDDFSVVERASVRKYCSELCQKKASWRKSDRARRARLQGADTQSYDRKGVFERDGWTCQVCGESVDKRTRVPHPKAATIDHIVPLSQGGDDTRKNVQCAHFECNTNKHAGSAGSQLLLLG